MSKVSRKPIRAAGIGKWPEQKRRRSAAKQRPLHEPGHLRQVDLARSVDRSVPTSKLVMGGIWLVVVVWAYWPLLLELIATWQREPDYSHGFLVIPLALAFLWIRRGNYP